ncbi:O-acetyltransferase (homolog to galactoside O-acetyltransferase) [Natrialba magadii ATCC 43099]|uniref:Transferase n=1 Tax=Natrialba magadii (strain ATCC 43099 / DSM 3394 / CCM 3739 / CIP 104546 / IAM 13178 / JCM 8861 / NBRC 102185 / NCIMB 2190 / MS3) TaxID=547559 RepID=D3ST45_NATMM|nr:acyltransferase [Natrialba magadii]ADD04991.1 O-acetyltransferase (homolog to galactoside O-acetyltransferase) [Natrialba magadii ATCC 43099]ELY24037.1 transferase [Natrialba magadii ATCC 43099]
MTKRYVSLPDEAESGMREFIEEVDRRLSGEEDTCSVVEDVLIDLSGDREAYERWQNGEDVSPAEQVRLQSYDPCNTTLESEYYAEKDEETFRRSKHLQWLWRQFDSLPIADNVEFALRFRGMLADHLFEECGENCRFFKGVTFTYGHNITIGDNTIVHDDVHLDDRGELTIGDRVSISDGVHIYSHDHDVVDQTEVRNFHTVVEDDVRLTYDSMIRAGNRVGENAIVGARAVVQHDIPAHHIAVGMPAQSVKIKPGWESVATPIDDAGVNRQDERHLPYDLPDDFDVFDEFDRDLQPPN